MIRRLVFAALGGALALWACSDGAALRDSRFACVTSGECADGYECLGGECQLPGADDGGAGGGTMGGGAGGGTGGGTTGGGGGSSDGGTDGGADAGVDAGLPRDAGVGCTSTSQCQAGLTCTDGVCCRTACSAPCDSCNQAGNLGTCLTRPAGAVSSACMGYSCNGSSISCPSSCALDAGYNTCASGYTCLAPTCRACFTSFTESFSTDLARWTVDQVSIDAGALLVSLQSRPQSSQAIAATVTQSYALNGCGVSFELPVQPTDLSNSYSGGMALTSTSAAQLPQFGFTFDGRGLVATWAFTDGGTGAQVLQSATSTFPRWLRIEESGGNVRWRTANTTTFVTVNTVPNGDPIDSMKLSFGGSYPAQGGNHACTYTVDNVNLGP